jgi:hypothetical protein
MKIQLKNQNLFHQQAYINGEWIGSDIVIDVTVRLVGK